MRTSTFQNMIDQVSCEMKLVRWSYVPLSTLNGTKAVRDGNDVNDPNRK
jgi:hypothetical protein